MLPVPTSSHRLISPGTSEPSFHRWPFPWIINATSPAPSASDLGDFVITTSSSSVRIPRGGWQKLMLSNTPACSQQSGVLWCRGETEGTRASNAWEEHPDMDVASDGGGIDNCIMYCIQESTCKQFWLLGYAEAGEKHGDNL